MSGKSIEGILQNIEMTPEKRTDNVEGKQSRGELVNEAEIGDSRSNTKHSRVLPGVVIPSPFKNSLFWPEPTKKVIRRNIRVKVPSVGTSDAWREYFLKKEDEQKISIQENEDRKRKREENKKLRQEKIKKPRDESIRQTKGKNTTEEEKRTDSKEDLSQGHEETGSGRIANEGNTEAGPSIDDEIKIGDFVIVNYFDNYYPAQITNKNNEKWLANSMAKAGGWWKWPNTKNEIWYDHHEIVKKIEPPVEITKRGFYAVEEIKYHI
ncbi:uncharacterized protein [Leptinotarsa decemlineata]|uniref:uncharacterized protein n=1 Tax=Leptinotarsa decemlineata TaxID=7539 RepID=UPI003D30645F